MRSGDSPQHSPLAVTPAGGDGSQPDAQHVPARGQAQEPSAPWGIAHCTPLPAGFRGAWDGGGVPGSTGRESWQLPETGLPSFSAEGFLLHQAHLRVVGAMRARGGEQRYCPIRAPQGEVGGSCLQEGCFGVLLPACERSSVERRWKRLVGSRREFCACFSLPMAFSFSLSCLVPWFTCLLSRGQI